jgi:structural maintenance of chromosome 1
VEYERAKAASEKATDASTVNYTKKRSIAGEVKHYREQKEEIQRWEEMKLEKVIRPDDRLVIRLVAHSH